MFRSLLTFFAAPVYPDNDDKTRKSRYANAISLAFMVIVLGYEIGTRASRSYAGIEASDIILISMGLSIFAGWLMLRRGYVNVASTLLVVVVWLASNTIAAAEYGIRDSSFVTNFLIILMAGLLLGWKASVVVTALSVISAFGVAYAEDHGLINPSSFSAIFFAQDMTFLFGLNAVLIYLLINGLEKEILRSKKSLEDLELSNTNLSRAQIELEKKNADMAQHELELESANNRNQRRAAQFEVLAQVTQAITSVHDLQELLPRITTVISEKFGFYHVGIFLLDEIKEFAVLSAANSEGGKSMLERKHRLRVGDEGIVGNVTATGKPRIALDVGKDEIYFGNPDLPDTRSEMALPLMTKGEIIGALDVQSLETGAFRKTMFKC